jgi:hypothetical protein
MIRPDIEFLTRDTLGQNLFPDGNDEGEKNAAIASGTFWLRTTLR